MFVGLILVLLVGILVVMLDQLSRLWTVYAKARESSIPGALHWHFGECATCGVLKLKWYGKLHVGVFTFPYSGSGGYALYWYCAHCAPAAELVEAMSGYDLKSLETTKQTWMRQTELFHPFESFIPKEGTDAA